MSKDGIRCAWTFRQGETDDLEGLHGILMCASRRGCNDCVDCSERALEMVLRAARTDPILPPARD